jgi:cytochrome c oxidase subunit 2
MRKPVVSRIALASLLVLAVPDFALAAGNDYGVNPAEGWENLWHKLLIDLWVIGIVFGLAAVYMLIKYRAKGPDDIGHGPKFTKAQSWAWVLIPSAIFIADDFFLSAKGWTLWNVYRRVPDNAMEVKLNARQWQWEFDYGQGVVTNELIVPVGQPVVLRMTAEDVIHSFFIPGYKVKEDVMPGRMTYIWFLPTKPGKLVATCTEFCGTAHADMYTDVIAVEPAEFMQWFAGKAKHAATLPAAAGNKS